jgi:hypothetical protein
MIYILYSDDYEVFMGGNYLPEKAVLVETTERLLSACENVGIPITLFCDLMCLWRYRELGYNAFPDVVDNQLKQTIKRGHDVQVHIHPHWLETEIIFDKKGGNRYLFEPSIFLLGNWVSESGLTLRDFCINIFTKAKTYLEDLLYPVRNGYRCVAFRAGGYGIQPHAKEILEALYNTQFLIDSSIVPGLIQKNNVQAINFSMVPRKGNYFVSPEFGLNQISKEGIFEIPLLALRPGEGNWLLAKAFPRGVINRFKHGGNKNLGFSALSSNSDVLQIKILSSILKAIKVIRRGWWCLELQPDVDLMVDCTRRYIDQYNTSNEDLFFSFSCHSKLTNPTLLDGLKRYHLLLNSIYGNQLKAITFQEAARILNGRQNFNLDN